MAEEFDHYEFKRNHSTRRWRIERWSKTSRLSVLTDTYETKREARAAVLAPKGRKAQQG